VTVKDGRVTLAGTVGSAAEKRWAIYDAWVVGAHDVDAEKLNVQWWARDDMRRKTKYSVKADDDIAKAVEKALRYDPRVFSENVDVEVNAGIVTMNGKVAALRARQAAGNDARNTVGVRRVRNMLTVRTPKLVPDARVTENVEKALSRDPYLEKQAVEVYTINGIVTLSGTVDTTFERAHAADITRGVSGVLGIRNNLLIQDVWSWKSDFEIREDIRDRLKSDALLKAEDITVEVNEGEVTLAGMVDTWNEKSRAGNIAQNAGASRVHNNLVVRYGPPNTGREYFGPYYEYDSPYQPEPFGPGPYGYGPEGYLP
jgi:osmotically-inducible protein OsmY